MTTLIICGAAGDLAGRYLLPALARLLAADALPDDLRVRGISREPLDTASFREHVRSSLAEHAADLPDGVAGALIGRCEYLSADVTDAGDLTEALTDATGPVIAYLALPPALFAPAISALAKAGLPADARVVVEKPFGQDQASARHLNELLAEVVAEPGVFRVDHFLAKQTVQNVLGLRFANRIFEPMWNSVHIDRVDIVWDETLALEGRAGYYDRSGALRDMIQNHLLQLLCLVAMEPPQTLGERDLRDRKVQLLRSVRGMTPEEAARRTVRARYTAGTSRGRPVPDYTAEPGVDPANGTETFAEVTLAIDNWRWAGVPFRLRSGKALGTARSEISVHFKPVPHLAFGQSQQAVANVLRLRLAPDRIDLLVNLNGEGDPFDLETAELGADLAPQELPAYSRLLLDVLEGDPSLTIRDDEAEESWRIVEPILAAWQDGAAPLLEYPAGSQGPNTA
ncbi:glucose-6-phosphate 1-dehydrogenase [Allonocardiopsis opalescens]|uniref:Glucose-6-phosphate 1-dehydrogenase n=1 Tax=Allonocardiopsis opalescens TaxID=1144618 RepID=A0A2T0Q7N6_9ACTN|nr:glucose-6-phosphate 1-dehydrogenase [Allonocardiopsis opalescens]